MARSVGAGATLAAASIASTPGKGNEAMAAQELTNPKVPLGRPGQPAELGSIYVQLAAADASYANGQVYGASGGAGQP